jgi:hypothetical protein
VGGGEEHKNRPLSGKRGRCQSLPDEYGPRERRVAFVPSYSVRGGSTMDPEVVQKTRSMLGRECGGRIELKWCVKDSTDT